MWLFKKKIKEAENKVVKSMLCIPGFWIDPLEIINGTNGKFMVVGNTLMDIANKQHYSFEWSGHDDRIKESFNLLGRCTNVSDDFTNAIDRHTSVVYISCETGSLYNAWFLATAGAELLKAGGMGVKVETTGKVFEKEKWLELIQDGTESAMYELFVIGSIMMNDGTTFSCGMQNIGFEDVIISNEEFADAVRIIKIFNYYQVNEKPTITANQTFQTEISSPYYRISKEVDQPYKWDELFSNPFGMWRLTKQ